MDQLPLTLAPPEGRVSSANFTEVASLKLAAEVGLILTESYSLGKILEASCQAIFRNSALDLVEIWTFNEAQQILERQASAGQLARPSEAQQQSLLGTSRIARIFAEKRQQLLNQLTPEEWGSDQEWAQREGLIAFAGYPLIVEEKVVGVLAIFSLAALSADRMIALGEITGLIARGIVRQLALEQMQAEARALETLNRIVSALSTENDLTRLVQVVTDEGTKLSEGQFGAFFYNVKQSSGGSYMLYTLSGVPIDKFSSFPMPRNTAIFAPTFAGESIVRLTDVTQDLRYGKNNPYFGMPKGHLPVRSYLAVPVIARSGEVLGGLFFGHERAGVFTERHEKLLVAVAQQAAIGIERARLYLELGEQYAAANEAQERYRALIELSPQFVWMANPDGRITYCNQTWYDYTGLSEAETHGLGLPEAIHPEDRERALSVWRTAAASGTLYGLELRFRRNSDNTYRWHLAKGKPARNADGDISHWVGVAVDIQERKETEAALAHQSELTRTITDNAASCLFMMDRKGHPTFMNPAASSVSGYKSLEEIKDRPLHYAVHWKKADGSPYPMEQCPIDNAQAGMVVVQNKEEIFCTKDGRLFPVSYSVAPLQRNGEVVGAVLEFRDITAQKEAEAALAQSEVQFRSLANSIPQLAWMAHGNGDIFWYNQRWFDYTGSSFEDVQGWGWERLNHPSHREKVLREIRYHWQKGEPFEMNFPLRNAEGEFRWFLTRAEPIKDSAGKVVRWFGTNTDITAHRELENALKENEERLSQRVRERTAQLEASNKELEAFSYSVSHDLRAPLRGIDGFSDVLLRRYGESLDSTGRGYLLRVKEAASRMGLLIEEMLKLSRLTRREMRHEWLDLSAMAENVVLSLRERDPARQVEVEIATGLKVEGDPVLMAAVLENLLGNAWKFTSKREGSARIEVKSLEREGETIFLVRDNGAGFDMEYLGKLFSAFQRLHSQDEFEGTGIGLASVQRAIHRHGGRVWAEGTVDQGAAFYFTIGDKLPERG